MSTPRNPFLVALVVIAAVTGVVAVILAASSAGTADDPVSSALLSSGAGLFAQLAVAATLCALVAAAITWRPARSARPAPERTQRDVDTEGMTEGEKRFFSDS